MITTKASSQEEGAAEFAASRWTEARRQAGHLRGGLVVAAALFTVTACGRAEETGAIATDDGVAASTAAATALCGWDPGFGLQYCRQSNWWLEFSIRDPSVTTLAVEISGTPPRLVNLPTRVDFAGGVAKFTGGVDQQVRSGTLVRLRATQATSAGGSTAMSAWFGYRKTAPTLECQPCTPLCSTDGCGSDGCGGSCGTCLAGSTCTQGRCICAPTCPPNSCGSDGCGGSCGACDAGTTCIGSQCVCTPSCAAGTCGGDGCGGTCACEGGALCSDGQCVTCAPSCAANTCGGDGCGGSCGTCAMGATCTDGQCVTCTPSCAANTCGSDGCGGTCGPCGQGTTCVAGQCVAGCVAPWNPTWTQLDSAGEWWTEFQVAGGGALTSTVTVMGPGGDTWPLSFGWGRWAGGVNNLIRGTWTVLHATNALGASAQTVPFRYLVDTSPLTDQCQGTPATSTTCQPLARGLVTLTIDDSGQSQADLAVPLLRKYGLKATFFHVPQWLTWASLARTLATEGHETGAHTMTHRSLTGLSAREVDDELRLSKQWLEANVSSPVESFATPSGAYNASVIAAIKPYFSSHRTTVPGLNYVGSDVYELGTDFVVNTSTVAGVCAQLAEAAALRGWLILTFHDYVDSMTAPEAFTCPASIFEGILACAKNTPGLDVVTSRQGVAAIRCGSP